MDNVVVMAPSTPAMNNDLLSDESESESISLDLHVSDTDDPTDTSKNLLESEEEILNKFADEEKHVKIKVNGIINSCKKIMCDNVMLKENITEMDLKKAGQEQKTEMLLDDVEKSLDQEKETKGAECSKESGINKNANDATGSQETDENAEDILETSKVSKNNESKDEGECIMEKGKENKSEDCKKLPIKDHGNNKIEETLSIGNKDNTKENNTEEDKVEIVSEDKADENADNQNRDKESDSDHKVCDKINSSDDAKKDDEDEEDLLQVMETTFVEDQKDENSCSSSEKENEELDNMEDNQDELDDLGAENEDTNMEDEDQENEESMQVDDDGNQENYDLNNESNKENVEGDAMSAVAEDNDFTEEATQIVQGDDDSEIHKGEIDQAECDEETSADVKNAGAELSKDIAADDDMNDCPMDIEESGIGGVIITDKSPADEKAMDGDVESNKENENVVETHPALAEETAEQNTTPSVSGDDVVTLIDDDVTDDKELKDTQKKSTKRKQLDKLDNVSHKKLKLEERDQNKVCRQIEALKSFKDFMRVNTLKVLSRHELEEFCLQKMCEWIIDKSELAEVRQKVKILEQTLDNWRKEAVTVAKQTRDLKIVHDRVTADLKLMREQTGKPLVPVKITRSVGLQAVMDTTIRKQSLPNGVSSNIRVPTNNYNTSNVANNMRTTGNNAKTPVRQQIAAASNTQNKASPQRTVGKPLQPITAKDNSRTPTIQPGTPTAKVVQQSASPGTATSRKSTEPPKAVIDLTDDEERTTTQTAAPSVTLAPSNRSRLNGQSPVKTATIATTNGTPKHVMLMPTSMLGSRPVVLKVNSNLVSTANGITIPTTQVSIVTSQPKNGSQVRVPVSNISAVRQTSAQKFKHPAPLPLAPASQQHIIVGRKPLPPRPILNLTRSPCGTGIVLQWKMPYQLEQYEAIISYQLYAYQETKTPPRTDNWGKIGDVKALELPMAVTLTQFAVGNRYFFAVRAVDTHNRLGPFSEPQTILL